MPVFLDFSSYFETAGFKAGFSLNSFSFDPPKDREELAVRLGLPKSNLIIPKQIHGSHVAICSSPGNIQNADGVISVNRNIVLSIQVADCIPLFILDKKTNLFGLIHAGWRGTANGIVLKAMNEFLKLDCKKENIIVFLGPSIKQCCFEVGQEVATQFPKSHLIQGKIDRSFLDLQGAVIKQLHDINLLNSNIIDYNECTHCYPELYHSFRRDGKKAGRMIAISGWL